jgi:hypothetical protein
MNSALLTPASAGHAKDPKSPWIQVTDIPFSLTPATVQASIRENDDPAVKLSQLPDISPKSIRVFDICTDAGGTRPVGLLLQQHLRRWFTKIKFLPLVHSSRLQSHLFDRYQSLASDPNFLNALWDESREGLDVGIALQLPCTQMSKQYKPLNLGHSFTYLVCGLSKADELVGTCLRFHIAGRNSINWVNSHLQTPYLLLRPNASCRWFGLPVLIVSVVTARSIFRIFKATARQADHPGTYPSPCSQTKRDLSCNIRFNKDEPVIPRVW